MKKIKEGMNRPQKMVFIMLLLSAFLLVFMILNAGMSAQKEPEVRTVYQQCDTQNQEESVYSETNCYNIDTSQIFEYIDGTIVKMNANCKPIQCKCGDNTCEGFCYRC